MANDQAGRAHWIDHIVVGTNDMTGWVQWAIEALGVTPGPVEGLTTEDRAKGRPIASFIDIGDGSCHFGAFLQPEKLPQSADLGKGFPRYGFFVRPEDIDAHLLRLDQHTIPHTGPVHTSAEGDDGTAVYFEDPDGNQFEFWAPDVMPDGAMEVATATGVGRVSSAVYGSRDLQRSAAFCHDYFGLTPADSSEIPEDTLVLPLAAGGRLVYNLVDEVDERLTGHGPWFAMHAALMVEEDRYMSNYLRLWDGVPEETGDHHERSREQQDAIPAHTGLHGSPAGRKWKELYSRGDEIYDPDGHAYHFIGGLPKSGNSLATYVPKEQHEYLKELMEGIAVGKFT
jgi:catechol 2,3-dioxygenase-like lactoylglutathione lyase family enzyme